MPTRRHGMLTESVHIIVYVWMLANGAILTVKGRLGVVTITEIYRKLPKAIPKVTETEN